MFDSRDFVDRLCERLPDESLPDERAAPAGCEAIVSPPALGNFLDPSPFDQSLGLQAMQCRIERGDVKRDRSVGALLNLFPDLIAMPLPIFEECKYEQFRTAALELPLEHR